jgi:ferredoxin
MTKIKITVDKNKCIGSASCVVLGPQFFDLDADGKSEPLNEIVDIEGKELETLKKAVNACPVNAISIENI